MIIPDILVTLDIQNNDPKRNFETKYYLKVTFSPDVSFESSPFSFGSNSLCRTKLILPSDKIIQVIKTSPKFEVLEYDTMEPVWMYTMYTLDFSSEIHRTESSLGTMDLSLTGIDGNVQYYNESEEGSNDAVEQGLYSDEPFGLDTHQIDEEKSEFQGITQKGHSPSDLGDLQDGRLAQENYMVEADSFHQFNIVDNDKTGGPLKSTTSTISPEEYLHSLGENRAADSDMVINIDFEQQKQQGLHLQQQRYDLDEDFDGFGDYHQLRHHQRELSKVEKAEDSDGMTIHYEEGGENPPYQEKGDLDAANEPFLEATKEVYNDGGEVPIAHVDEQVQFLQNDEGLIEQLFDPQDQKELLLTAVMREEVEESEYLPIPDDDVVELVGDYGNYAEMGASLEVENNHKSEVIDNGHGCDSDDASKTGNVDEGESETISNNDDQPGENNPDSSTTLVDTKNYYYSPDDFNINLTFQNYSQRKDIIALCRKVIWQLEDYAQRTRESQQMKLPSSCINKCNTITSSDKSCLDTMDGKGTSFKKDMKKVKPIGIILHKDFFEDTIGVTGVVSVPRYEKLMDAYLPLKNPEGVPLISVKRCYNCGQPDHDLKDCPEEYDGATIADNKKFLLEIMEKYNLVGSNVGSFTGTSLSSSTGGSGDGTNQRYFEAKKKKERGEKRRTMQQQPQQYSETSKQRSFNYRDINNGNPDTKRMAQEYGVNKVRPQQSYRSYSYAVNTPISYSSSLASSSAGSNWRHYSTSRREPSSYK